MRNIIYILILILLHSCSKSDIVWVTIGDSITARDGEKFLSGSEKGNKIIGYQTLFTENKPYSITVKNEGYSGFSLSGNEKSIYQEVKDKNFSDADIVTIFVGTNDFKLNRPIISKDTLNSFRYCYSQLIDKIKSQNNKTEIYLITPLKRNNDGYTSFSTNKVGLKLTDYREEIINLGHEKNVKVIDMFLESGIDEGNLFKYTVDGLHPNNEGYLKINDVLNHNIIITNPKVGSL
ncbi:SGNH/GDSL hydrolase family protein [Chryseobacterium lathyri]|uniref:SGNH/GDSL hydrolase family protein n=1 Tax=Chryseobacterium lathyri TaxID=395933 RepID=UPI001CC0F984|nr:SGNH/GDSL hydrolase family protein [Chryseobacterium lathyri]